MSCTITDNDKGLKRVLIELVRLRGGNVTVGIHQQDADHGEGASNVLIGSVMEFGAPDHKPPIPARPFLRPGVRAAEATIRRVMEAGIQAILHSETTGKQVLQAMGEIALRSVLQRINSGIKPPLAYATILNRLRRTKKGRKLVNAGARATRSLQHGGGKAASWTRSTFGKRADGSHGHIAGEWKVKGRGSPTKAHKALIKLAQAAGGSFTPLVDTGQLRASITAVVTTGGFR